MSEIGSYIRTIEAQINNQIELTKNLALNTIEIKLERGGSL